MIFLVLSNESVVRNGILLALQVNEYLNAIIIIQLSIKLPLLAAIFRHQLCCSAASNGGQPICAFLFQVRVFQKNHTSVAILNA
jgi:hypothetical protein